MPRSSGRKNRSVGQQRHPLSESEIAQQRVRDLEKQIMQKDVFIVSEAKRLNQNGVNVETGLDRYASMSPISEVYMSPIRIGVADSRDDLRTSSPIRITSARPYHNTSPPRFNYEHPQYLTEHSPSRNRQGSPFGFGHPPPDSRGFDQHPPQWHDMVDVRVDEMPIWPMNRTPSPEPEQLLVRPPYPAVWHNQEQVQVDPMPVYPVMGTDGQEEQEPALSPPPRTEDKSERIKPSRKQQQLLQMQLIAQQADEAESVAARMRTKKRTGHSRKETKEEKEQREAREDIRRIRSQVSIEKKKEETERRKNDREKRHAEQKKEEEEKQRRVLKRHSTDGHQKAKSSVSSASNQSSSSDKSRSRSECDEKFLKLLKSALGQLECEAHRIESRSQTVYKGSCFVVNIPKELIHVSCERDNRGEAYSHAIRKYVNKLVDLGVINENIRQMMARVDKGAAFMAELVEPLCNEIAIYGTQISVTETLDMKDKFITFCKDKSLEFWKSSEVREKLHMFLTKHNQMNDVLRTLGKTHGESSRIHSERNSNKEKRRRTRSRSVSPSNKASLERLFASHGPKPQSSVSDHLMPQMVQMNNFMAGGPNPTSFLPMPSYSQPHMMPNAFPPQPLFHQNPTAYHPQMNNGYPMRPSPQPLMSSPMQQPIGVQHRLNHHNPNVLLGVNQLEHGAHSHQSKYVIRQEEDIDLMDEIFK